MQLEIGIDIEDDDLKVLKNPMATRKDLNEHLAYMASVAKRRTEVSLSKCTPEEKQQFMDAMAKETDQWISNSVFPLSKELASR